jgi:subtilisin family serine protease
MDWNAFGGRRLVRRQQACKAQPQRAGTALGGPESLEMRQLLSVSQPPVVAIIDSGIDVSHPYLAASIWTNPGEVAGNGVDDDRNGYVDDLHGWNFVANTANVHDGYGHGTHVAGVVAAVGTAGVSTAGIGWNVSLMALKFQDDTGLGFTGAAIAGIQYATMMRRDFGVNVVAINVSWGGTTGTSTMLQDAIRAAGDAGITFVAAAGNSGADNDAVARYPSGYDQPNVIAVAATGWDGSLAGFSNYGATTVDLGAPGAAIYSTLPGGRYGSLSGTSQAAPQVSGAVARLAAAKPGISVAEVRTALFATVDKLPSLAGRVATGGRLNVFAALASVSGTSLAAPAPVVTQPVAPVVVSPPVVKPPIGAVQSAGLARVTGWAFSERAGAAPIQVRVVINGQLIGDYTASFYRPGLRRALGSVHHGYSIALGRARFQRGWNELRVEAFDPVSGQSTLIGARAIRRVV